MSEKVPISKFTLVDDYREEVDGIQDLAYSIKDIGLLHPIHVDKNYNVLEGRRRFRAMRDFLKLKSLEENIHFFMIDEESSSAKALLIQWTENIQRKDFKPQEAAELLFSLHKKLIEEKGKSWTQSDTANFVHKSKGYVSKLLTIAQNKDLVENVETLNDALNKVGKVKAKTLLKKIKAQKVEKIEKEVSNSSMEKFKVFKENFLNGDALELIKEVEDNSINAIITDPPFGIELGDTLSGDTNYDVYEDHSAEVLNLLRKLSKEWYRVLKEDSFIVVWISFQHAYSLSVMLENAGFKMKDVPLIWVKGGYAAKSRDEATGIGNVTEIALYGYKGSPQIKQTVMSNVLNFPIVRKERIHVAQKPESLQRNLISMFTEVGDKILDCFAGSASLSRAAIDLGRIPIAFELDENNYNNAIDYSFKYWSKR